MDLDVPFPGAEFLLREQIATAGLFETDDTAPYRSDDRGLVVSVKFSNLVMVSGDGVVNLLYQSRP